MNKVETDYLLHLISLVLKEKRTSESQTRKMLSGSIFDLEKKGVALRNMVVKDQNVLVPGTMILSFEKELKSNKKASRSLPSHKIEKGDMVEIRDINVKTSRHKSQKNNVEERQLSGIVYNVLLNTIEVAVSEKILRSTSQTNGVFDLVKKGHSPIYNSMLHTLHTLLTMIKKADFSPLTKILLGMQLPTDPITPSEDTVFFNASLNENQRDAVSFSLNSPEISLIHGPPGTGKTHTLVEIIIQFVINQKKKVLVCGPSHVSVDNLLLRVAETKDVSVVRVGSPARVSPLSLRHTLDVQSSIGKSEYLKKEVEDEIQKMNYKIKTQIRIDEKKEVASTMTKINKIFKSNARRGHKPEDILNQSNVTFCTLAEAGGKVLKNRKFDIVVIDEAGQATEPECWLALVRAKKCILAGDHLQLPPTVLSEGGKTNGEVVHVKGMSKMNGLSYTLFDRLLDTHGAIIKKMLVIQYRMHSKIMEFSSKELYEDKLVAHESVEKHALHDLKTVIKRRDTATPITVIDTSDTGKFFETASKSSLDSRKSIANDYEAKLVVSHLGKLLHQGLKQSEIGVITPYAAQVKKISILITRKWPDIEVKTVDGFQGREKEAIVLSLVRSNKKSSVGFLSDKRRLNVAMTRAKRHLAIMCDLKTVGGSQEGNKGQNLFLSKWSKWLESEQFIKGSKKAI